MRESYRFRTGSGRIVVMVPDHAVRSVDGRENAWRESATREHPFGRSALGRARDDFWRSPGSGNTYTIDLGMLPSPGRALGFEKPGELAMPPWDDIPFLRGLAPKEPLPSPSTTQVWFAAQCVGRFGTSFAGASVELRTPNGGVVQQTLDGDSRLRVQGIDRPGSCSLSLLKCPDQHSARRLPVPQLGTNTPRAVFGGPMIRLATEQEHLVVVEEPYAISC